ncbi:hypothetical protein [Nocardia cyriacigeorgica]|uniref:Uncharacterized protein n=1 Tax=Nocardia cyriacigeorgica TaxID=135487 RepID=A0A5R8NJK5_9NOCA|nr:hypothetical protein [Nocardia cyriacigeorgica]TLF75855.1 hypothetical protein FEK34_18990 [Nocardia cyriacigeorgica]
MSITRLSYAAAVALAVTVAGGTATAAPLTLEPAAPVATTHVDDNGGTGSASGSAETVLGLLEILMSGCTPGTVC